MTEKKLPQAGEWWRTRSGERRFVLGIMPIKMELPLILCTASGTICHRIVDGRVSATCEYPSDLVEHLPWCTSFDDVEPVVEVWPKYYQSTAGQAFIRRDSRISAVYVYRDGRETSFGEWDDSDNSRKQLTESEALSLLTPKCHDCGELAVTGHADVCPMAWVVQDRVAYRSSDSIRWSDWTEDEWYEVREPMRLLMHGDLDVLRKSTLTVRCRRKDLPPLPEPKAEEPPVTRQRIRLWVVDLMDEKLGVSVIASSREPRSYGTHEWREINHDANGFYIEYKSSP